ncbi:MAG: exonuclease SbcCD subunit D C-terminal domain-containing protein [Campylobacterales bacterium]
MKLLHTSDWHLGQNFMGKSRQEEHKFFLQWLLDTIAKEDIDVLVVAGDIFDTSTPPNYALELYYNFLTKLSSSSCKYVIIIAGNHDSISTLKASKELLKVLNVYVIASGDEDEEELIEIYLKDKLEAIVCAVPFLRDYVVRKSLDAQSMQDKEYAFTKGIKQHYVDIYNKALKIKQDKDIPIIATGHFTTVGSKTSDSEKDIYIGGTLHIDSGFLSDMFDYTALGHLHINQSVGSDKVCYSGSPIELSFSEASSKKKVNIITFVDGMLNLSKIVIPLYRNLYVIDGDMDSVLKELESIEDNSMWIEINLRDDNPLYANQVIRQKVQELGLSVLAIKSNSKINRLQKDEFNGVSLDELSPLEVFEKCLEKDDIDDKELKDSLVVYFKDILSKVER